MTQKECSFDQCSQLVARVRSASEGSYTRRARALLPQVAGLRWVAWFGILAGCSARETEPASRTQRGAPIERSQHDRIFAIAAELGTKRDRAARFQELAATSTGALLVPFLDATADANQSPLLATNGTRVRGTCGATLVAPSYVVTSAHCVSAIDIDLDQLVLEMYRPDASISQGYLEATVLRGQYPDYEHGRLTAAEGYFVDRYPCSVVSRCGRDFGPAVNCDEQVHHSNDVALLKCEGRPGDRYGFLDIAPADIAEAPVFMPWKHEVYDIDETATASDTFLHYVVNSSQSPSENYHYHGADAQGLEQNQLLSLVSVPFSDGSPHTKVDTSDQADIVTDLMGCHGTSGAGALQASVSGFWQLLGPARHGDAELNDYLCDHVPTLVLGEHLPGTRGISYAGPSGVQHVYARNEAAIIADCARFTESSSSLFMHLACLRAGADNAALNSNFVQHLVPAGSQPGWDYLSEWVIELAAGESVALPNVLVSSGKSYRLGLNLNCTARPCPNIEIAIGKALLETLTANTVGPELQPAATLVSGLDTDAATISVRASASGGVMFSGFSLIPASHVSHFDTAAQRLQAVLLDLSLDRAEAQPMRFTGDGNQGFAARLFSNERLLLTRQAIVPGQLWSLEFKAMPPMPLFCGLLDASGTVVSRLDCSAGVAQLDDRTWQQARAGVFIESVSGNEPVTIDDVRFQIAAPTSPMGGSNSTDDAGPYGGGPGFSDASGSGGSGGLSAPTSVSSASVTYQVSGGCQCSSTTRTGGWAWLCALVMGTLGLIRRVQVRLGSTKIRRERWRLRKHADADFA